MMDFDSTYSQKIVQWISDMKERKIKEKQYIELRGMIAKMVRKIYPYNNDYEKTADIISEWTVTAMRHDMHYYKPEYIGRQIRNELINSMIHLKIFIQPVCITCGRQEVIFNDEIIDPCRKYVCKSCQEGKTENPAEMKKRKAEYYREYRKRKKAENADKV